MKEALAAAYLYNPTLKSARAQLRSTDEGVARARSGFRPTITGEAIHSYQKVESNPSQLTDGESWPRNYSVTLNQPLFRGFRTINAVKGAEAAVEAGREELRGSEHTILFDTVTAYVNVVRDEALLKLQEHNFKVLSEQLKATQDRFDVGEVTKTDVAQAKARTSGATSSVAAAKASLQSSRAVYAQLIGHAPGTLKDPGPWRHLPAALAEAQAVGEGENPSVLSAIFRERAQDHVVKQTKGELLPTLDLQAKYTKTYDVGGPGEQETTTVLGRLTVPVYEAGEVWARVRQALETQTQLRHEIDVAREKVRSNITSAWGVYVSAKAQIVSDTAQVDANTVALSGVKEEEKVGQRTVLDVLNAEQELLSSQVALTTSKRNLVVASYGLLAAMGRIAAVNLNLAVEPYDPTQHYRQVEHKWIGWGVTEEASETPPAVAPVTASGWSPQQERGDGPAYRPWQW